MKRNSLVKVGGVLMVALGALIPMEAKAYPFQPTPEGFTKYINGISIWESGRVYRFSNPRNCEDLGSGYKCNFESVETSGLGTRKCIDTFVYYSILGKGDTSVDNGECSAWEKVSARPEPQSQPTPPPSQPQTSTTTSTTLNNNLILAGGAGVFVAGGLLGVAFSQLLGRKKK